jgi:hypothetical protein
MAGEPLESKRLAGSVLVFDLHRRSPVHPLPELDYDRVFIDVRQREGIAMDTSTIDAAAPPPTSPGTRLLARLAFAAVIAVASRITLVIAPFASRLHQ